MKIRSNIVANCSDFVWSLDIPDIDGIRTALKTIVETTNWKVYASIGKFALDLHSKVIFPVDIDDIEIITYKEEDRERKELAVSIVKIFKKIDPSINEENIRVSKPYLKYMSHSGEFDFLGDTTYLPLFLDNLSHIPNTDNIFVFNNTIYSKELSIHYTDGYCDNTFVLSENQPGSKQLDVLGKIMQELGGNFHHEDGGYGQADDHREWFEENGYSDILGLELN